MKVWKSEFYFIADIENIVRALDGANASMAVSGLGNSEVAAYRAGFHDALAAVAVAVGGRLVSDHERPALFDCRVIESEGRMA